MIKGLCQGSGYSAGGIQGGMSRGRKSKCPICFRMIGMRPGRAGRLFPHSAYAKPGDRPPPRRDA